MDKLSSLFESRDLSRPAEFAVGVTRHRGVNRRHQSRRQSEDRRDEIRFELNKPGRREGLGRRNEDSPELDW
jgi:hypothetical protein